MNLLIVTLVKLAIKKKNKFPKSTWTFFLRPQGQPTAGPLRGLRQLGLPRGPRRTPPAAAPPAAQQQLLAGPEGPAGPPAGRAGRPGHPAVRLAAGGGGPLPG